MTELVVNVDTKDQLNTAVGQSRIVRRAWKLFSQALRHHPQLDYYVGSYFIGPGQPLVLDPAKTAIESGWMSTAKTRPSSPTIWAMRRVR